MRLFGGGIGTLDFPPEIINRTHFFFPSRMKILHAKIYLIFQKVFYKSGEVRKREILIGKLNYAKI